MIKDCCERARYYLEWDITDNGIIWKPRYRFWVYNNGDFRPEFQYCPFCGQKLQSSLKE